MNNISKTYFSKTKFFILQVEIEDYSKPIPKTLK